MILRRSRKTRMLETFRHPLPNLTRAASRTLSRVEVWLYVHHLLKYTGLAREIHP
jgi:hypothetical protein